MRVQVSLDSGSTLTVNFDSVRHTVYLRFSLPELEITYVWNEICSFQFSKII